METAHIIDAADVFLNGEDSSRDPSNYYDADSYAEQVANSFESALRTYLYERIDAGDYVTPDTDPGEW